MMSLKRLSIPISLAPTDADVVRLSGRERVIARVTWFVVAALALGLLIASIPQYVLLVGVVTEQEHAVSVMLGSPALFSPSLEFEFWSDLAYNLLSFCASALCLFLAALIFHRKPEERMAFVVSLTLLVFGIVMTGPFEMLVGQRLVGEAFALSGQMLLWAFVLFLFYIFPDGHFIPRWTRWLAILLIPWGIALALYQPYSLNSAMILPFMLLYTVPSLTAPLAQIYRYRRFSNVVQRQQTKWVIFGFTAWIVAGTALTAVLIFLAWQFVASNATPTFWSSVFVFLGRLVWPLSLLFVPLSLTVAILRYRLFEIDLILNHALVYGSLTAFVIAAYVLIVGAFGAIFQSNATLAPLLLATVIVALLMRPLHAILKRSADRWIHSPAGDAERIEQKRLPADDMPKRHHASWSRFARAAWLLTAVFALLALLASIPPALAQLGTRTALEQWRDTVTGVSLSGPDVIEFPLDLSNFGVGLASTAVYLVLAVVLFRRKGNEPFALSFSLFLLVFGTFITEPFQTLTATRADWFHAGSLLNVIVFQALWFFFFLFPNGRFVPHWTRWLVPALALWIVGTILFSEIALPTSRVTFSQVPFLFLWHLGFFFAAVAAQIYRYRRVSNAIERQQTKWVVLGFSTMFFIFFLLPLMFAFPVMNSSAVNENVTVFGMRLFSLLYPLFLTLLPLSMAIAILRYHLFDIDLILNRALVYGALTAIVGGIFILIVAVLGALFQTSGNLVISLLATAAIAVLFQPLRERLQRAVNRLTYGERDDPYAVIARLGQRLEATLAPDAVLPTIVETIATTLKLPYAAISLKDDSNSDSIVAAYGRATNTLERFPLVYQHESIGELIASRRVGDGALSRADRNLLETLANQAAVAAHAVRLTSALQHSRERLVTAREEERRRIRRDLHDGLGPALASITLKLDAARNTLKHDPPATDQLLGELKTQSQEAIQDIRRLVYALRPPALDELGLVGALREYATRSRSDELDISMQVREPLPPLSAAVEVATYRIITEAITNVQRHAHARHCHISLVVNGDLQLEIQDDGAGLPERIQAGVGMTSMRERAAELGGTCVFENASAGGTRVVAKLPIVVSE